MICRNIQENLKTFIDNKFDSSTASAFRLHLDQCSECMNEYTSLSKLLVLLRASDPPEVANDEWNKIHDSMMESIRNARPFQHKTIRFPVRYLSFLNYPSRRAIAALLLISLVSVGVILLNKGIRTGYYPKIVAINGNAFSIDAAGSYSAPLPSEQNLTLPPGRTVHTDNSSSLQIQVDKRTTINLGNNSRFSVSDCAAKKAVFKLNNGGLAAQVSKRKPDQLFRIETPNAFCEVIGTRFNVSTYHDKFRERHITTLVVEEGTVKFGSPENQIPVKAGHAITLFGDSLGSLTSSEDPFFKHFLQKPGKGLFTVASTPTNAVLFINGKKIGMTPYSGSLPFGKHGVVCKKDGFSDWTGSLIVDNYSESLLDIQLYAFSPLLKKGVKLAGNTRLDHPVLKRAHELLLSGNYQGALNLLTPMADNSKLSSALRAAVLSRISNCHKYSGNYPAAIDALSRIINGTFPQDQQSNALFERASINLYYLKNSASASKDLKHYTATYQNGLWIKEASLSLADIAFRSKDYRSAADAYRKYCDTFKDSPECEKALFTLGMIYSQNLSDFNRAISTFNQLQLLYPQSNLCEDAIYWSADCLLRQGQTSRAISSFENYSRRFPNGKWHAEVAKHLQKIETAGAR